MCFDNRATRANRKDTDKLAAFIDIWTMFITQLPKYFVNGTDLCVDEQLVAFGGRCGFGLYILSEPAKYRVKIKPHILEEMKASNGREEHSSMFGFNDQLTLVSYISA